MCVFASVFHTYLILDKTMSCSLISLLTLYPQYSPFLPLNYPCSNSTFPLTHYPLNVLFLLSIQVEHTRLEFPE